MFISSPGLDRRAFLRGSVCSTLGLCVSPSRTFARAPTATDPPARAVIHVFLDGGLSHIDTFDPKPAAPVEYRGEFDTIRSRADGEPFTELLPRIADIADRLTVIRSLTHGEADHDRGKHSVMTGYRPSPAITYPSIGSVVVHELGGRDGMPGYVCMPAGGQFDGTGYLSAAYGPFEVGGDPNDRRFAVRDLASPSGIDEQRLARRQALVAAIDESFAETHSADAIDAGAAFYEDAYDLVGSKESQRAFDVKAEPSKVRDRYGRNSFGQRLLMARRLVASGVRYVLVRASGFDHHDDVFRNLRRQLPTFDRGLAALVADLDERGMLESTLVLVTTEFGRTPRVNQDSGRDHWPRVFSGVIAGGGIKRGYVHGASNATGSEPDRDPVTAADLAATVYWQLGIDFRRELMSPGDRPIEIVRDARVVRELIA